ncbi:RES family NAD+ phosphorylase [Alteromonas sp. SM 2104]|nr:RES family NAD+ phosphorylase [Alteromonas oceanisediminis]
MQGLTNPRLRNELGNLNLLAKDEIPYGITGLYYAIGPFVHVNPDGSRFSNGDYGVLYIGDSPETALSEVKHHQQVYWSNVEDLAFERFVFRQLKCTYTSGGVVSVPPSQKEVLAPDNYTQSRQLGAELHRKGIAGVHYPSVRYAGGECFGFFTPKKITEIIQTVHIEMIFNGRIVSTAALS